MGAAEVVERWARRGRPLSAPGAASRVWEEGEGPPVVCVHGVPSSAFVYRRLLPELAARGLRGLAFDLPGLGLADRPQAFDYSWSGLGGWCQGAVEALELERFHLVLQDIGGPIGLDLARRVPGRVLSLTCLNAVPPVASFRRPWFMEPYARRGIGRVNVAFSRGLPIELLLRWKGNAVALPRAELRAHGVLLQRGDRGRAFLQIMRSFERTPQFEAAVRDALARRPYPAQLVWGVRDTALRVDEHGEQLRQILGLDTIHRLPGKHFVQEDCPAEVADYVAALAAA